MKKTTPLRELRRLKRMGLERLAESVRELGVPIHASSISRASRCLMDLSTKEAHATSKSFRGEITEWVILYPGQLSDSIAGVLSDIARAQSEVRAATRQVGSRVDGTNYFWERLYGNGPTHRSA